MTSYVVVVRYPSTTATQLYDWTRYPDANAAGVIANNLNASGGLGNATAYYREEIPADFAETKPV